jgi:hypothetical protein
MNSYVSPSYMGGGIRPMPMIHAKRSKTNASDESWAAVARNTREALGLLGYPIESKCLPGETDPCGATFALHAAAHLAKISAICDHQMTHLGPSFTIAFDEIYAYSRAELDELGEAADVPEGGKRGPTNKAGERRPRRT